MWDSIFGKPKKKSKKQTLRENQEQGKRGEKRVESWMSLLGWDMKRAPKGQDYIATKTNQLTGRKTTERVEVKTGNANLSPLQKKKKRQYGSRYQVVDGSGLLDGFGNMSSKSSTKKTTSKRRQSSKRKHKKSVFDI